MPAAFPDLDAPIVAGEAAAGIALRSSVQSLLVQAQPDKTEHLPDGVIYTFQAIKVWASNGLVHQVGVCCGYRGRLEETIGIGSTIAEVERWSGCSVEEDDEDNLIVPAKPGWSFETEIWSGDHTVQANRNAAITEIFVQSF